MNVKYFSEILRPQNQKMSAEARRKPQKARTSWGLRLKPSNVLELALTMKFQPQNMIFQPQKMKLCPTQSKKVAIKTN